MKNTRKAKMIITVILAACLLAAQVFAQLNGSSYSIPETTVSNGGGTITRNNFSLDGIIGQPLGGNNIFVSSYEISSNFWSSLIFNANTSPTISDIGDQATNEDNTTGALFFTIGDAETPAANLTVAGSSSNTTLVPNANIVFGGSGANRSVTLTPAANQNGKTTITITVTDAAGLIASDSFVLNVLPVNDPPKISDIADQITNE